MVHLRPMLAVWLSIGLAAAQDAAKAVPGSLTIEDVIGMAHAKVEDDIIITRIKRNAKPFDLNADEIVALKKEGVSDPVIKYLVDPSQPYATPAPPPPPAPPPTAAPAVPSGPPPPPPPPPKPPLDPRALKVPPEPGLYYWTDPEMTQGLDLKPAVPYKQPGKLGALSAGVLKGHVIGSFVGPKAMVRVAPGEQTFFFRLGEKASIDDLRLLQLDRAKDRRNLDFGTKPGKPVFPVSSVRTFESKEVSPGIFRITAMLKSKGEYVFFILGSGDEKKDTLGKGYELGID